MAQPFRAANAGLAPCATVVKPVLLFFGSRHLGVQCRLRRLDLRFRVGDGLLLLLVELGLLLRLFRGVFGRRVLLDFLGCRLPGGCLRLAYRLLAGRLGLTLLLLFELLPGRSEEHTSELQSQR